ncbi:uncharacterized protein LOC134259446 isoform X2 [Saccostrea cucullata]|uniref:uncharacterized protein LOC134259446 isoform X2 n=1 Tax=Saccostrea cuccullata TaxID=36930 RepID=UPI002ED451B4
MPCGIKKFKDREAIYTGKCCVQFNGGLGRIVEDYSVACSECPFHYYSNESITYPSCFQSIKSIAVPESTIQPTVEVTSKSSNSSSIAPIRKKCRSATGRRKRHLKNKCEIATTTVYFIQSNKTNTTTNKNTSRMNDVDFTMVIVTLTAFIIFGVGAVLIICKGVPKVKLFYMKYSTDQVRFKSRKYNSSRHDICYKQARNDEPVQISTTNVLYDKENK